MVSWAGVINLKMGLIPIKNGVNEGNGLNQELPHISDYLSV